MSDRKDAIVAEIFARFEARGHMAYGEDVTELEHALQSATFAERDNQPPAMIVACLLHDFGHLCHDLGETIADEGIDAHHEELGARALAKWFPPAIVEPGRLHVAAKRYLCAVDPVYRAELSPASVQSLALQGGPMTEAECAEFEALPWFREAVTLRKYDDLGKVPAMATPPLSHFEDLIRNAIAEA